LEVKLQALAETEQEDMSTEATADTVRTLAESVVQRVLSVYREDYIERCVRDEPNSLLALVKRLELELAKPPQEKKR
jgi:hypothetical protein